MPAVKSTITPTDREEKLFGVLKGTLKHAELDTVLRCAGGWVRDKLLGKESHDIDIAVDNMLGREFAEHVNSYLSSQNIDTHRVAVITSNPEQSKHLETARMKLDGLELDLVNLRSETYADTRIPEMSFGTPTQDAERRDFTINSLFYNINTGEVEDFTGRGLDDLRNGLMRTPLPPMQTFLDDPLRVLRALRFAARFNFELDAELQEAALSKEVREALAQKVSRERMGTELDGMFNGPDPVRAMRDMQNLRLFPAVFAMPAEQAAQIGPSYGEVGVRIMEAAGQLLDSWQPQGEPLSTEERRLALMAALLLPLRAVAVPLKGKKTQPLPSHILLKSIKWKTSDADGVEVLHREATVLLDTLQQLQVGKPNAASDDLRIKLGMSLRSLKGPRWRAGILLAPLLGMPEARPLGVDPAVSQSRQEDASTSSPSRLELTTAEARSEACWQLEAGVRGLGLEGCWAWKPLLAGKDVMEITGVKAGPKMGQLTAKLVNYQLAHPSASVEDARTYLKSL